MDRVLLGFVPTDLAFLKAGGRLSNVAFLGAHLLKIKPCIEVTGGKFVATKKFRGSMLKCFCVFFYHMDSKGENDSEKQKQHKPMQHDRLWCGAHA